MNIQIVIKEGYRIYPCKVYEVGTLNKLGNISEIYNKVECKENIILNGYIYNKEGEKQGEFNGEIEFEKILSIIQINEVSELNSVYTLKEASEKWALADGSSIRKAIERNKFYNTEIKQSGSVWIVTESGMNRVFGPRDIRNKYIINIKQLLVMKTRINILEIKEEFGEITKEEREELFVVIKALQKLLDDAIAYLNDNKSVLIRSNSKEKPVEIINSKEEFLYFIEAIEKKTILFNSKIAIKK